MYPSSVHHTRRKTSGKRKVESFPFFVSGQPFLQIRPSTVFRLDLFLALDLRLAQTQPFCDSQPPWCFLCYFSFVSIPSMFDFHLFPFLSLSLLSFSTLCFFFSFFLGFIWFLCFFFLLHSVSALLFYCFLPLPCVSSSILFFFLLLPFFPPPLFSALLVVFSTPPSFFLFLGFFLGGKKLLEAN